MIGFGRTMRNLGGYASQSAKSKASSTSLGNNTVKRVVKHQGRGSSAGLEAQKTARLAPNGAGYSNPSLHQAKNSIKTYPSYNNNSIGPAIHFSRQTLSRTNDFRTPKHPR